MADYISAVISQGNASSMSSSQPSVYLRTPSSSITALQSFRSSRRSASSHSLTSFPSSGAASFGRGYSSPSFVHIRGVDRYLSSVHPVQIRFDRRNFDSREFDGAIAFTLPLILARRLEVAGSLYTLNSALSSGWSSLRNDADLLFPNVLATSCQRVYCVPN